MLETLITSKTRIKILLKFFINPNARGYLRELAKEMNESTNSVRVELDKLVEAGYLEKEGEKNKVFYRANVKHKLFPEIHNLVKKYLGIDVLIDNVLQNIGHLKEAYLIGDYAEGKDSGIIDIVLIGRIDENYLIQLIKKAEQLLDRKIRYIILTENEKKKYEKPLNLKNGVAVWKEIL
ncbi:MAG: transcriptional regulator [Leptospiraceae bacterium]|nr:MAG: transcriptional regulator [Leptospiraceae bacterium]